MVHLPKRPAPPGVDRPAPARTASREPARHRVLVVDDNADAAESVAILLRLRGHQVRTAFDGDRAIRLAARFRPDIALLDIGLPGMSGLDVGRALRSQAGTRSTVLVALTGYGQAEDLARSREAGFDHHLVKPVDPEALERLIASIQNR